MVVYSSGLGTGCVCSVAVGGVLVLVYCIYAGV